MDTRIDRKAPHGKAKKLAALRERYAHELMGEEERLELRDRIAKLERKGS